MMTIQKSLLVLVAFIFLLPAVGLSRPLGEGDQLQSFTATDMNGQHVDLAESLGRQPIMLVFWASWCPQCKVEVPKVNELFEKYRNRGMYFLGINVGHNDSERRASQFINKTGMAYPVIYDNDHVLGREYGVQGVPTVLIVNRQGLIVFRGYGVPDITEKQFLQLSR